MGAMSAAAFKRTVAQALHTKARIRELAQQECPRCFSANGGVAVLAQHTFRPGMWRVHFLDWKQEPVASVDAPSYAEALCVAHMGGANLFTAVDPPRAAA